MRWRRQAGANPADAVAEAYYQFMLGASLEDDGDVDGAIAAFRQAHELDPSSADVPAELAGLYAAPEPRCRRPSTIAAGGHGDPARTQRSAPGARLHLRGLAERERRRSGAAQPGADGAIASTPSTTSSGRSRTRARMSRPPVRLALARLYLQGGTTDQGDRRAPAGAGRRARLPQGVAMLAQAYTDAGRRQRRHRAAERGRAVEPSFYEASARRTRRTRRWDEAAAAYEQALAPAAPDTDLKTRWAAALLNAPAATAPARARPAARRHEGEPDGRVAALPARARPAGRRRPRRGRGQRAPADGHRPDRHRPAPTRSRRSSTSGASWAGRHRRARAGRRAGAEGARRRSGADPHAPRVRVPRSGPTRRCRGARSSAPRRSSPGDGRPRVYLAQALVAAEQFDRALAVVRAARQAGRPTRGSARSRPTRCAASGGSTRARRC